MDGNLQCGQLSHVAEGVRCQCADAVVAQVPVEIQTYGKCTQTNAHMQERIAFMLVRCLQCLHKDTLCVFCSRLCEWYIHQRQLLQGCQLLGHRCQHITLQVTVRKGAQFMYYTKLWDDNTEIEHIKVLVFTTCVTLSGGDRGRERRIGYVFGLE